MTNKSEMNVNSSAYNPIDRDEIAKNEVPLRWSEM